MTAHVVKDLVVLTADKNMELAIRSLLVKRAPALGIRPLRFDTFAHPERDPGCRLKSHVLLRGLATSYSRALVMFDRAGCGSEGKSGTELEGEVGAQLEASGWAGRAAVIVLDPELEVWVWARSPHVEQILGWKGPPDGLRTHLEQRGLWSAGEAKPRAPKEAVEHALWIAKKPRSSAVYERLAGAVSLAGCTDAAFVKFHGVLTAWFGP